MTTKDCLILKSKTKKFKSIEDVNQYLDGDKIQCLVCGKYFKFLTGKHLKLKHNLTSDDYRERWGLPHTTPLAGKLYREVRSKIILDKIKFGTMTYEHLQRAALLAAKANKPQKRDISIKQQSELIKKLRPGDKNKLADNIRRLDGRNALRAREYQIAYRALKSGSDNMMIKYKRKWK